MKRFTAILLICGAAAHGQINPVSSPGDARIADVRPDSSQVIALHVPSNSNLDVLFPLAQRIETVVLGDVRAFKVAVSGGADRLEIIAQRPGATSKMTVKTDVRDYEFVLSSAEAGRSPYLVRIQNGLSAIGAPAMPPPAQIEPTFATSGRYRLTGSKDVRPTEMSDDGLRTYIKWAPSQAMPAVFALDRIGHEEMVNGYMRDGAFTIDRVHLRLVFRIDKAEARATRLKEGAKR